MVVQIGGFLSGYTVSVSELNIKEMKKFSTVRLLIITNVFQNKTIMLKDYYERKLCHNLRNKRYNHETCRNLDERIVLLLTQSTAVNVSHALPFANLASLPSHFPASTCSLDPTPST